jgi:hypothetical protein
MMLRILGGTEACASAGGNFVNVPADDESAMHCVDELQSATQALWNRKVDLAERALSERRVADAVVALRAWAGERSRSHVFFKRSAPFLPGDVHRPDLHDVFALVPDARVIVIYRDPAASAHSSFRRGFEDTLGACAVTTAEQLALLARQVETLPRERMFVMKYETFCTSPDAYLGELAAFCELDLECLRASLESQPPRPVRGDEWRGRVDRESADRLQSYMDARGSWWTPLHDRDHDRA